MKLSFKDGSVIAIAESLADVETLQSLLTRKHKPHKKHNHMKTCELCGKDYKGLQGLGIHMAKCRKKMSLVTALNNAVI